ncbi:hypothetical protein DL96DRAFT_1628280, partial [Flagelloscypha sp. PMI_526]
MSAPHVVLIPDELLEHILLFCCAIDVEGRTARTLYSVCRRWHHVVSPFLYHNLAVLPPTSSRVNPQRTYVRLFRSLERHWDVICIQNLLLRVREDPRLIFPRLAKVCSKSLVTLTLWHDGNLRNTSLFLGNDFWPNLCIITLVGNTQVNQHGAFTALNLSPVKRANRHPSKPHFPSLTTIHVMGTALWPPVADPSDLPKLHTFRISLVELSAFVNMIPQIDFVLRTVRYKGLLASGYFAKIRSWEVFHGDDITIPWKSDLYKAILAPIERFLLDWGENAPKFVVRGGDLAFKNPGMDEAWFYVLERLES